MTARVTLSCRAEADLDDIWDDTVKRWGVHQAEVYTRELWATINTIAERPTLGRRCDDIRPGYHKYPAGSHFLFYRMIDGRIDVVRILHKRMDFPRHF